MTTNVDDMAARLAGRLLREAVDDLHRIDWSGAWPVIDGELRLTGDVTEGNPEEGPPQRQGEPWYNYQDVAMIREHDARSAGWALDSPDDGYALPPVA